MEFLRLFVYGREMYRKDNITATQHKDKMFVTIDGEPKYSAGFVNISAVESFFKEFQEYDTNLYDLGFVKTSDTTWEYDNKGLNIVISYDTYNETFDISTNEADGIPGSYNYCNMRSIFEVIRKLFNIFDRFNIDPIQSACMCDPDADMKAVTAAISSRNLSKNLQRVKSSNLWSYGFDSNDSKSRFGTMLIQFKGNQGGPGDIYQYFDVPINLWRRFISAKSKGHFFWVYIRNNFNYRKLTGDKRGKLPNAIN